MIEILLDRAATDPRAAKLFQQIKDGQDTAEQKSAVDRYQSSLLMPDWLMREAAERIDVTKWPNSTDWPRKLRSVSRT